VGLELPNWGQAFEKVVDRLSALSVAARVGILIAILAAIGGAYYGLFYLELMDERDQLAQEATRLATERGDYEKRKQEYLGFRNEINGLLEEQKRLLEVLPRRDDIEQFIENMQTQVELSGLSKVSSMREAATPVEIYLKIPVRMSASGTFHQIFRFFRSVSELKRIVNIEDLQLLPDGTRAEGAATPQLKASFLASTFQFVDKTSGTVNAAANKTSASSTAAPAKPKEGGKE
jgi:type IV pilus assembly protein PilO